MVVARLGVTLILLSLRVVGAASFFKNGAGAALEVPYPSTAAARNTTANVF